MSARTGKLRTGAPKKPNRRKREYQPVPLSQNAQIHLALAQPETYVSTPEKPYESGRRPEWDPAFRSAVRAIRGAFRSNRATHTALASDASIFNSICDGLEVHYANNEEMLGWVQSLRVARKIPSRATVQRWASTGGWDADGALAENAYVVAHELGSFNPDRHSSVLDLQRCVAADGKVLTPPSGQPPETVDKATAEIKERRHDPASKLYRQGDNEAVVGPKFAVLLAPTPDQCTNEIVLAVTPVEEAHPKGEALQVATALIKFDTMLRDRTKGSHFVSALVMDGAPDSEIHNILVSQGIGLMSPPSRTSGKKDRTHTTGAFIVNGREVRFTFRGSRLFELVNVDGEYEELATTTRYRTVRGRNGTAPIQYLEVDLTAGKTILMPFARMDGTKGRPKETANQHMKRLSLMRAAQAGDPHWIAAQLSLRGMSEGFNSRLEDSLYIRRLNSYGTDRQKRQLALTAIFSNLVCLGQYRQPPPQQRQQTYLPPPPI